MAADDGDGLDGGAEGQDGLRVLEQDDGLLGDLLGELRALGDVGHLGLHRVIKEARGEDGVENAVNMVVQLGLGDFAGFDGLLELFAEEGLVGLLHVETGMGGLDGGVGSAPVREDEAVEVEGLLEDLVEQVVVLAGEVAIDAVV